MIELFENWSIPITKSELGQENIDLPEDVPENLMELYKEKGEGLNEIKKSEHLNV